MPGYRRILVALDFSESNAHTVAVAADLAAAFKARLELAHVVPLSGLGEAEARAAMETFAVPGAPGLVGARSVVKALSPDLGLLQLARERGADLIVVGTHGRSGLAHIRLGSTAERVVQHATCPVLTVRDPRFSP
ncbi:MAG TPA: universal stress protein [Planctomycetota bacterium]|nr:universal stress protein [Planctomycetota bacterium]